MKSSHSEEHFFPETGMIFPVKEGVPKTILEILKKFIEANSIDALLVPVQVPNSQAFSWVVLQDKSLLDQANPLPPAMSIQGGRALTSLTHRGEFDLNVAAVLRPCEARAAVELYKIKQVHLNNVVMITLDCPGAVPLADYIGNTEKMTEIFQTVIESGEDNPHLRPICRSCRYFSLPALVPAAEEKGGESSNKGTPAADLHLGFFGQNGKRIQLIPLSPKGEKLIEESGLKEKDALDQWREAVETIETERQKRHSEMEKELLGGIKGIDAFTAAFDACINCHNCMRVCPICYCRQCYFDSKHLHLPPEQYLDRAEKRGALRFPMDSILFHLGRMSHMVLSCVACGACEDACPVSIPVAQIFSAAGDSTRKDFHYIPGRDRDESPPLQIYSEEEFCEAETPNECAENPTQEVKKNA